MKNYDFILRSILIGDSNVGKTSLLRSLVKKPFEYIHEVTIGVEFEKTSLTVCNENGTPKDLSIYVWDTAGSERYRAVTHCYFSRCCIAFLVYDVTNRESFENLEGWLEDIKRNCKPHVVVALVGNKTDLYNREVYPNEGIRFANKHGLLFMETSAKNGDNVEVLFSRVAERIVSHTVYTVPHTIDNGIQNGNKLDTRELMITMKDQNSLMNKCCIIS